jgi:hypothetical protein
MPDTTISRLATHSALGLRWYVGEQLPHDATADDHVFTIDRAQMAFLLKALEVAKADLGGSPAPTHLPSWLEGFEVGLRMSGRPVSSLAQAQTNNSPVPETRFHPECTQSSDHLSQTNLTPVVGLDTATVAEPCGGVNASTGEG